MKEFKQVQAAVYSLGEHSCSQTEPREKKSDFFFFTRINLHARSSARLCFPRRG